MKKIILIGALLFFFFNAFSAGRNDILKRWTAVTVVGDAAKKESYANRFAKEAIEIEFKNGKFYSYQKGKLKGSATYLISSDGKTISITEDGAKALTIHVVFLNANTLHAVLDGFLSSKDTVIFKVSGSKEMKTFIDDKTNAAWKEVQERWDDLTEKYASQQSIVDTLVDLVKNYDGFNRAAIEDFIAANDRRKNLVITSQMLSRKTVDELSIEQGALDGRVSRLMARAEASQTFTSKENWIIFKSQYEERRYKVKGARQKYNESVNILNRIITSHGGKQKDIAFMADAGSSSTPAINF